MALSTKEAMEAYQKENKNNVWKMSGDSKSAAHTNQSKLTKKYRSEINTF